MSTANDDFTESADTDLAAHAPTGSGAGANGWLAASGLITVVAASDVAVDDNGSAGNRYVFLNDLGSYAMDLQADFTSSGSAGSFLAPGFLYNARPDATLTNFEAGYDHSIGVNGSWRISGPPTQAVNLDEAWPGGTVTIKVEVRKYNVKLYANGVLKVTMNREKRTRLGYAGLRMLNFTGVARQMTADNYTSIGVAEDQGVVQNILRPRPFKPGLAR